MLFQSILAWTAALASLSGASAKLDLSSPNNVAVYWGQNSYRGSGNLAQQNLSYYCDDPNIDVLILAFVMRVNGAGGVPEYDFADTSKACPLFNGTNLPNCPQIGNDITTCQQKGKTVILSIGGATYSEGGFASDAAAQAGADLVWQTFGPPPSLSGASKTQPQPLRPFGNASVDGFDFDFEATVNKMAPFANRLRALADADPSKPYFLTAAPQCPYPDLADQEILNGPVAIDAVWVQFYNNPCGLASFQPGQASQPAFNFAQWDTWARTVSQNKDVRVFVGAPANTAAAGSGYVPISQLQQVIQYAKSFKSFGGVMLWDVTQAYANPGYLSGIRSALTQTMSRVYHKFRYPQQRSIKQIPRNP
ncbi:glycoside hydrolase family 18 protein [Aspergillus brunneoviolaceus CBS 621.78]|uniref:Class III chitinase n=1 Tax=Aspergillus brunneoviolaceus CBS 621.78 TaxID=1450534 RepID=A0ACD1GGW0_9EURO|nr:class III chitinase [Aspergillus brunneoviolaceus CBS 621.78]RAH48471.1 class III chitinase [Aspergillus brunneoviolaceus CBS 621.78]